VVGVTRWEEFTQTVDSLPNFNGDVIVNTETTTGTFINPEHTTAALALAALCLAMSRRRAF